MSDSTPEPRVIQIPLTKDCSTIVDECDADLGEVKWTALRVNKMVAYAHRTRKNADGKRVCYLLHRVILERIIGRPLNKGEQCDHINRIGTDNRRCNLRLCTHQQNMCNHRMHKNNKTGYRGVAFRKGKYNTRIRVHGQNKHLGYFTDIKDAARAYNEAALKYHGEFASLNVIEE